MMTSRMPVRESFRNTVANFLVRRRGEKESKSMASLYSYRKGLFYSIFLTFSLWWIPILGPAVAGYISGRRAGDSYKALQAGLVTVALVVLFTFALLPFKSGPLGWAALYLSQGVVALSSSNLAAVSNIGRDIQTTYGLIMMFAIVLPSSIMTLLLFSYVGGNVSSLKVAEEHLGLRHSKSADIEIYRKTKDAPTLHLSQDTGRKKLRQFELEEETPEEEGMPFTRLEDRR